MDGDLRRIMVPVGNETSFDKGLRFAARMASGTDGELRLVHARIWDPPVRGSGRFYPESTEEALHVLERSLAPLWSAHLHASGIVVDAERGCVAASVAAEAAFWEADVIVVAGRPRRRRGWFPSHHLSDDLARCTQCPVLAVSG